MMSHFRAFIPIALGTNEYLAAHILKANLKVFQKTPFEKEMQSLIDKIDQIVPEDDKDGNLMLTMKVGISPELITWILGWHRYVKVLKPRELINEVKKNLKETEKLYQSVGG